MSRAHFDRLLRDRITVVKPDGRQFEDVKASVQSDSISIYDTTIPLEEGDKIYRPLPHDLTEEYIVLDRGYHEKLHTIPARYQAKVRKVTALDQQNLQSKLLIEHDFDYIDPYRINELRSIQSTSYDLSKLIALCEEINKCYRVGCYFAVAMLVRSILDHVPPIFGQKTFAEVANNYKGARSFKEAMHNLDGSSRKIADSFLHVQIRAKEVLPNKTQVNFSNNLDVLLSEIARVIK
jgi:hypothetical protein